MTLKFNKENKLEFDICDLLDSVSAESKVELIESLSCDEAILKHVVDQILDGWTENAYHGSEACTVESKPRYSLDFARREISKRAGEVAKTVVESLEKSLAAAERRIREYQLEEEAAYCAKNRY